MSHAYAQLQRIGQAVLRAQGFARTEERTHSGQRFFLYDRKSRPREWAGDRGRGGEGALDEGTPILLVHGLGGSATSFLSIARQLAKLSPRVALIDLPGHGQAALGAGESASGGIELSQALGRALELLERPALLIGNSLGGALVLGAALLWPERVKGVIALAPAGAPFNEEEAKVVRTTFRGGAASGAELGRRLFYSPPWVVRLLARGLGENIAEPAVQHIVGNIHAGEQGLPEADLRAIRVPALVLWGAADAVLPPSGADYFRRVLPPGSVEVLERCGHLPQVERPRAVLSRIERFLEELPRLRAAPDRQGAA